MNNYVIPVSLLVLVVIYILIQMTKSSRLKKNLSFDFSIIHPASITPTV